MQKREPGTGLTTSRAWTISRRRRHRRRRRYVTSSRQQTALYAIVARPLLIITILIIIAYSSCQVAIRKYAISFHGICAGLDRDIDCLMQDTIRTAEHSEDVHRIRLGPRNTARTSTEYDQDHRTQQGSPQNKTRNAENSKDT